jgi:ABC-2 type transport system ATP-binding protein
MDYRAWGTVGRAIDFVRGFYPDWNTERCEELQFMFGVHRDSRVDALSFGARMKLALVLALARDAELLVLDEPTLGLDAIARRQLFTELLKFMAADGRTILISSHQLTDLERFADHAAILNQGRLLTCGRMDRLVERYRQIDARVARDTSLDVPGISVIDRQEDRVRLLIDHDAASPDAVAALHLEVLAQSALTLEDIFLALIKSADRRSGWWPQMSAA